VRSCSAPRQASTHISYQGTHRVSLNEALVDAAQSLCVQAVHALKRLHVLWHTRKMSARCRRGGGRGTRLHRVPRGCWQGAGVGRLPPTSPGIGTRQAQPSLPEHAALRRSHAHQVRRRATVQRAAGCVRSTCEASLLAGARRASAACLRPSRKRHH